MKPGASASSRDHSQLVPSQNAIFLGQPAERAKVNVWRRFRGGESQGFLGHLDGFPSSDDQPSEGFLGHPAKTADRVKALRAGDEALEFVEPVLDNDDLGAGGFTAFGLICRKYHDKPLAVRRDVVVPIKTHYDEALDWKRLLVAERKSRFRDDID